jgi:ABC-type nitrate/sulfonate/bicarbonate transport system substrate-binding protein/nitrogen-specific signal transduction histidine kinase
MLKIRGGLLGLLLTFSPLSHALDIVTLQLKWTHQFQFAGYYMAEAKGFYRDVGLQVNFIEGGLSVNPVTEVLSERADFGIGSSSLILDRNAGKPVVALGVIFQHSPYVLLMLKTTPTQSVHDIANKRVVLEQQSEELLAYLKMEGVPTESLSIIRFTPNLQDLIHGRADAMSAYSTDEPYTLEQLHIPHAIYSPRSAGIDFYGDNFFTSEAEIKNHPERVKAFREATIKGWKYAMNNIDETVDFIHTNYAGFIPKAHLSYEANAMKTLIQPNYIEIGYMFDGRWRHVVQTYAELGMLPSNMSLTDFLYSPDSQPNFRLIASLIGAILSILIVSFVALRFFRLNKKLDRLLYIRNQHANLGESMDNISHQWKQPLNELGVHMMLIEMMLETKSPEESRAEIKKIVTKSHGILEFMAETIDVFRHFVSSSRKISAFDPAIMIQETLHFVTENFTMEAITLTHDLQNSMFVRGNATEFSHVLLSILVNAKSIFNERNTINPMIQIRLFPSQKQMNLIISDNAGGIKIKPIRKIFNAGVSGKKQAESGLGLYISKKIIEEKMRGTITAENSEGGAVFKICLPIVEPE